MTVYIDILENEGLKRTRYGFCLLSNDQLKFDFYTVTERKTCRHKFNSPHKKKWSRLDSRWGNIDKPDVPVEVQEMALAELMKKIKVVV